MESLFNAEVIKAAASSPLGTLSLMCLILGAIALAFCQEIAGTGADNCVYPVIRRRCRVWLFLDE